MRKLIFGACLMLWGFCVEAQQDAQYTQFMFNKLSLNPAYAGSADTPCFSCLHRSQWVGLDGAPTSQSLNFHMPFLSKRVGFGISLNHDKIGPTNSWQGSIVYAYRMQVSEIGNVSFGLNGTMRSYTVQYEKTNAIHSGDSSIPMGMETKYLPNFGFGLYYETKKYYLGLSFPRLLRGDLEFGEISNTDFSREEIHAYLMAGTVLRLSESIKLKPAILMKYAKNSPFDLDINANFIFIDRFWAGLTYRLGGIDNSFGESLDLVAMFQVSTAVKIGLSYDFTLSKVRKHQNGTYEVTLEYCLKSDNQKMTNPRFF